MSSTHEIEVERSVAEAAVARMVMLDRLRVNPDFDAIINKQYLESEAIRLVHLKGVSGNQSEASQTIIGKQIDAIGMLREYLRVIYTEGTIAANAIKELDESDVEDEA